MRSSSNYWRYFYFLEILLITRNEAPNYSEYFQLLESIFKIQYLHSGNKRFHFDSVWVEVGVLMKTFKVYYGTYLLEVVNKSEKKFQFMEPEQQYQVQRLQRSPYSIRVIPTAIFRSAPPPQIHKTLHIPPTKFLS